VDADTKPECVNDKYAIFVAPSGDDTVNDGSRARPVATIGAGITKAGTQRALVFVCQNAAGYAEKVSITTPINIYGGFDCTNGVWTAGTSPTNVAPTDPGPALSITNVASPTTIANLSFTSANATNPGDSSWAGWIAQSPGGVTLKNVALTAGNGQNGNDSPAPPPGYPSAAPPGNSADAGADAAGPPVFNACDPASGIGPSTGGGGGATGQDGGPGLPATDPVFPAGATGAGGNGCGGTGDVAHNGSYGAGADGGAGGTPPGRLTADGLVPPNGLPGLHGVSGQGGGGGAGQDGLGGGGGAGGCGGHGGVGGQAGGSSLALLVYQSPVTLSACTLKAGSGGNGGRGGAGEVAQKGSSTGGSPDNGCPGAVGGHGGSGGGGGAGAGGSSIALGFVGPAPSVDAHVVSDGDAPPGLSVATTDTTPGEVGDGGLAAKPPPPTSTASNAGNHGFTSSPGIRKAVVAFPP